MSIALDPRLVAFGAFFLAYYVYHTYSAQISERMASTEAPVDGPTADNVATTPYEPGIVDVLVVKAMLTKALSLPREIVNSIIDAAEYWPHTTTEASYDPPMVAKGSGGKRENMFLLRSPPLGLHSWRRVSHNTAKPVHMAPLYPKPPGQEFSADDFQKLIASPIPLLAHPCRRIVFTIKSHDQGWGGLPNDRGYYSGSWTWFEAGLERWCKTIPTQTDEEGQQSQQAQQPSLRLEDLCTVLPEVKHGSEGQPHAYHHPLHPREDLKIQCNVTAERKWKEHRVVWSYTDDIDPGRDVEAAEKLAEQGRGKATGNAEFVRGLKLGDVLTIWAKARFGGWTNHVESVRMEVYYAV